MLSIWSGPKFCCVEMRGIGENDALSLIPTFSSIFSTLLRTK